MSHVGGKRARKQAALSEVIDDDLAILEGTLPVGDTEFSGQSLRKLQKMVNDDDPQPVVPPYYLWSDKAQKLHKEMISRVATQIEKRIVVPADKQLHEQLRRTEAAHASEAGYASISLYDVRSPDPEYATRVRGVGDKPPRRIGGSIDHSHRKETTRILELRMANNLNTKKPVADDIVQSERFADCCMPVDCERALHSLNTYEQALRYARKLETLRAKNEKPQTLASFVKTLRAECSMPVFCVRLLYDATLEICAYMEANGCYFALFTFSFDEHVKYCMRKDTTAAANGVDYALHSLRSKIAAEIVTERAKSEKRLDASANFLEAPVESLNAEQRAERAAMLRDEYEFRSLIDKFHVRFEDKDDQQQQQQPQPTNSEESKIALTVALSVFAIEKSETLRTLPCTFRYLYFATCQCLTDDPDAVAAASTTQPEVRPASSSTTTMIDGMSMTSSIGFNFTLPAPTKR